MLSVVCQVRSTIHVAFQKSDHITVSSTSLYNKINGMEPHLIASLVRHISSESEVLIKEIKAENPALVKGLK